MITVLRESEKFYTFSWQVIEECGEGEQAEFSAFAVSRRVESVAGESPKKAQWTDLVLQMRPQG